MNLFDFSNLIYKRKTKIMEIVTATLAIFLLISLTLNNRKNKRIEALEEETSTLKESNYDLLYKLDFYKSFYKNTLNK